jgi:hypothetical protein
MPRVPQCVKSLASIWRDAPARHAGHLADLLKRVIVCSTNAQNFARSRAGIFVSPGSRAEAGLVEAFQHVVVQIWILGQCGGHRGIAQ